MPYNIQYTKSNKSATFTTKNYRDFFTTYWGLMTDPKVTRMYCKSIPTKDPRTT